MQYSVHLIFNFSNWVFKFNKRVFQNNVFQNILLKIVDLIIIIY